MNSNPIYRNDRITFSSLSSSVLRLSTRWKTENILNQTMRNENFKFYSTKREWFVMWKLENADEGNLILLNDVNYLVMFTKDVTNNNKLKLFQILKIIFFSNKYFFFNSFESRKYIKFYFLCFIM